jgi:hypothetical protein
MYIFLIHIFGDISSPILLGGISKLFGMPLMAASFPGRLFASIGAVPVDNTNLTVAMLCVVPILALGCVFFLLGSRHLADDMDRIKATGDEDGAVVVMGH